MYLYTLKSVFSNRGLQGEDYKDKDIIIQYLAGQQHYRSIVFIKVATTVKHCSDEGMIQHWLLCRRCYLSTDHMILQTH